MNQVSKAVIPIAGLGTRMLPLSKVVPKALLPVWNKPALHWIVEEVVRAGIEEIIFVYGRGQEVIRNYFGRLDWLEDELARRGKHQELTDLRAIQELARFHFVEQKEQRGDGHALRQARHLLGDDPFLVVFGDSFLHGDVSTQMLGIFREIQKALIGLSEVSEERVGDFGIAELNEGGKVLRMVEKPGFGELDSRLAIVGRYVLPPQIWRHLEAGSSASGEERLIDALQLLQREDEVYGVSLDADWYDVGSFDGLFRAGEAMRAESDA